MLTHFYSLKLKYKGNYAESREKLKIKENSFYWIPLEIL